MRIVAVKEKTVHLAAATRNSSIGFGAMTASALAVHTDVLRNGKPLIGLAFDSIGRYGHGGLLQERFIPRLTEADPESYSDGAGGIAAPRAWNVVMSNEKPGGHGERCGAVGMIDAALWDLAGKKDEKPLWSILPSHAGASAKIAVYASGGHYRESDDVAALCDDVKKGIAHGHRRFKIKIGGAALKDDLVRINAVLVLLGPGMSLAVDGNGTFDLEKTLTYLKELSAYPLAWVEEPVPPLDFDLHREIAATTQLPLATGENLFSFDDVRNLLRYAGLRKDRDIIQCDVSLSYGVVEYLRIIEELERQGWSRKCCAPHAGHLFAAHCVGGLGLGLAEVAMDTQSLFGRVTAALPVQDGIATLPEMPGAGFESSPVFNEIFDGLLN